MRSAARPAVLKDPVTVEVIKHELAAITEACADAIMKTGRSHMIKLGDFAASLGDRNGQLLGIAATSPLQLSALMEVLERVHAEPGKRPGDVFVTNDPYAGMGHLPDVAVIVPCFVDGVLAGYSIAYSHHNDIGGHFYGGSSSQSEESFEEGLRIPLMRLYREGVRDDALLAIIEANVRSPAEWLGDLDAKVIGCRRGVAQLADVTQRYGAELADASCDYLLDYSETEVRRAITAIPDGEYGFERWFEEADVARGTRILIRVVLRVRGDELEVDFTGSSAQVMRAINLPRGAAAGSVFGALKFMCGGEVVLNSGFVRPITITAAPGSVVNPVPPAPVGGRAPMMFAVYEAVLRALATAIPEAVSVPGEGGDMLHFSGVDAREKPFMGTDVYFGGWGGRPGGDGVDGVAPLHFGALASSSVEVLERDVPMVFECFQFVEDTGGPGQSRGSLAVERGWRFDVPTRVMLRTCNLDPPAGLAGGLAGAPAGTTLIRNGESTVLPAHTHVHLDLEPGDRLIHRIGGAGGFGDPARRDPEAVRRDVRDEKVSLQAARQYYLLDMGSDAGSEAPNAEQSAASDTKPKEPR